MSPPVLTRLKRFARSVWPAHSSQAALLVGAVLLLTVLRLGSWHLWTIALFRTEGTQIGLTFTILEMLTLAAVYFAGAAALSISFFANSKTPPLTRLKRLVFAPVIFGWLANIGIYYFFRQNIRSSPKLPLNSSPPFNAPPAAAAPPESFLNSIGFGFWVTIVALFCILMAQWSIKSGQTTLPVNFCDPRTPRDPDDHTRKFVWLMIIFTMPATVLVSSLGAAFSNRALFVGWGAQHHLGELLIQLFIVIPFGALLLIALGPQAWKTIRAALKFPPLKYVALAIALPFLVESIPPVFAFLRAGLHGSSASYSELLDSLFLDYFPAFRWINLSMIVAALLEEIAWRGYLQPRLISRYGQYRGIFFVGIIWGAFHFSADFNNNTHLIDFVPHLAGRLFNCTAWGFVLSWLTLRSRGSVIPAGIAHGIMNALIVMQWDGGISHWYTYALWAVIAFIFFRFWPPAETPAAPPDNEIPATSPSAPNLA